MVLGIVLCANMHIVILIYFILQILDVPIKGAVLAFFVGMIFFTWLLTIAAILMNIAFIKRKKYGYQKHYLGLAFSLFANILCLGMTILGILIYQRWIDPDFISVILQAFNLFYL